MTGYPKRMTQEDFIIRQAEMLHDLNEAARYMMMSLNRIRNGEQDPRRDADATLRHVHILMESVLK